MSHIFVMKQRENGIIVIAIYRHIHRDRRRGTTSSLTLPGFGSENFVPRVLTR
jgi:hypothetical protein